MLLLLLERLPQEVITDGRNHPAHALKFFFFSQNKLVDILSRRSKVERKGSGVLINEHADENKHAEVVDLYTYMCGVYSVSIFMTRSANHQGSYFVINPALDGMPSESLMMFLYAPKDKCWE